MSSPLFNNQDHDDDEDLANFHSPIMTGGGNDAFAKQEQQVVTKNAS